MLGRTFFVLAFVCVTMTTAQATVSQQDRAQAACYDDAQRLCGQFIPDSDKTEACMLKMKTKVSAACRKFYPDE